MNSRRPVNSTVMRNKFMKSRLSKLAMKPQVALLTASIGFATLNCAHRPSQVTRNENLPVVQQSPLAAKFGLPCMVNDADFSKTKQLLESGVPVDSTADECIVMEPSPRGVTLLMRAAYLGKVETVNLLLVHGANVNAKDTDGDTPVAYAVSGKNVDVISALSDKGADVNSKAELDRTPLMAAAGDGDLNIVNCLIDHGALLNIIDAHGTTALMFAAGFKQPRAVRALLRRGANPQLKDRRGRTYLDYAKRGFPDDYVIYKM